MRPAAAMREACFETPGMLNSHYNRQHDLILLQIRPNDAPREWKPIHTFNLISDPNSASVGYQNAP
jgi:hypothetical protein